jgi:hypothetical protein
MRFSADLLGFIRLVVAQGAAEIGRHDVGTPVFAWMIAASAIALFVIPMLYVTFQRLRERSSARFRRIGPPRRGETPISGYDANVRLQIDRLADRWNFDLRRLPAVILEDVDAAEGYHTCHGAATSFPGRFCLARRPG